MTENYVLINPIISGILAAYETTIFTAISAKDNKKRVRPCPIFKQKKQKRNVKIVNKRRESCPYLSQKSPYPADVLGGGSCTPAPWPGCTGES